MLPLQANWNISKMTLNRCLTNNDVCILVHTYEKQFVRFFINNFAISALVGINAIRPTCVFDKPLNSKNEKYSTCIPRNMKNNTVAKVLSWYIVSILRMILQWKYHWHLVELHTISLAFVYPKPIYLYAVLMSVIN